ncbi:MAG: hypothetical protein JWN68_521 [Nocardioides sp.]|nr:hypothetical protein [Nocardioides sp.]
MASLGGFGPTLTPAYSSTRTAHGPETVGGFVGPDRALLHYGTSGAGHVNRLVNPTPVGCDATNVSGHGTVKGPETLGGSVDQGVNTRRGSHHQDVGGCHREKTGHR